MKKTVILLVMTLIASSIYAYDEGVRIAWDRSTFVRASGGTYPRVKVLSDGRDALVYEEGAAKVRFRNSGTKAWGDAITVDSHTNYNYANSEMLELSDGTLLFAWNARPKSGTNLKTKIMVCESTNKGVTWSKGRDVYIGEDDGVWEPALIQLPSGEVQIYFANENTAPGNDQNITMIRSQDKGKTWGTPEILCYRPGSRDGMPVPVVLKNNKGIAFIIEDNGWGGPFKPTIIHTSMTDNWSSGTVGANSSSRWRAEVAPWVIPNGIYAGAPYLAVLHSGETVITAMSAEGRPEDNDLNYAVMAVYTGTDEAKKFSRRTVPFVLPESGKAHWGSIAALNATTVVATSAISGNTGGPNGICTIEGTLFYDLKSIKKAAGVTDWAQSESVFIGGASQAKATIKSMYDDKHIYFQVVVADAQKNKRPQPGFKEDSDGIELYLDLKNETNLVNYLPRGMVRIVANLKGETTTALSAGGGYRAADLGATINLQEKNGSYTILITLPWEKIGGKPSKAIGMHVRLNNRENNGEIIREDLSGSVINRPATWLKLDF